jgi:hypothetical protein
MARDFGRVGGDLPCVMISTTFFLTTFFEKKVVEWNILSSTWYGFTAKRRSALLRRDESRLYESTYFETSPFNGIAPKKEMSLWPEAYGCQCAKHTSIWTQRTTWQSPTKVLDSLQRQ